MIEKEINSSDLCFNLRKSARALTMVYDGHLKSSGLRSTQFSVLIAFSYDAGKSLTDISRGLGMDRTTISRNLIPLERSGLISPVVVCDGRSKSYRLTEKGKEVVKKSIPLWKNAQDCVISQIGSIRYRMFIDELNSVFRDFWEG